jgi:hypothetical protein
MVFFDVPRGGHSHNILRGDGPRPHLAATHLGRGRSCIVRVVYPEGFGRHRVWHSVYRLPYGVPRNQDAQRQSGIGERRPAALDRIAHRSHDGGWWKCSFIDPGRSASRLPDVRRNRAESWAFAVLVL